MATKSKKRAKRRSVETLAQQVDRFLAKGQFKLALKSAKVCYRQGPSPQARQLLERAYLGRARELYRGGLRAECRAVLEALLHLGVTEPSVRQGLPELTAAVGLLDRTAAGQKEMAAEGGSAILRAAADFAVLRPHEAPASLPAVRQGALRIRTALEALEAGKEAEALAGLQDIARGSAFADWKYFVRGLAAYYRHNTEQMHANWGRLDPARVATRIAGPLAALADPASADRGSPRVVAAARKLEIELLGEPAWTGLLGVQRHAAAGRWRQAVRAFGRAREALGRIDSHLVSRVGRVLLTTLIGQGEESALTELTSLLPPPPADPQWNGARAMLCEHIRGRGVDELASRWSAYLNDLAELPSLSPAERALAQALVWLRLGCAYMYRGDAAGGFFHRRGPSARQRHAQAVECFTKSLRLAPKLVRAYEALARAHLAQEQPDRAADVYRRLLQQVPEHLDALLFLAKHHQGRDEPFQAKDYVVRAHRLRPLEKTIRDMLWMVHLSAARHHALGQQWVQGRAELEVAEKVRPPDVESYHALVRRAVFEFKAGDFGRGHPFLDQARSELGEAAPVLLLTTIESIRYGLPKLVPAQFECQWLSALKGKCTSKAAGQMSRVLGAYLAAGTDFPGRENQVQTLLGYLRRCSRVKWQAQDLRWVCIFLEAIGDSQLSDEEDEDEDSGDAKDSRDEEELLAQFVDKGRKQFPEAPYFHFMAGELEIHKGPIEYDRRFARECFERVLQLLKDSPSTADAELVAESKRRLRFLEEVARGPLGGLPVPPPEFFDDHDEDDEANSFDGDAFDADSFDADSFDAHYDGPAYGRHSRPATVAEMLDELAAMCRSARIGPEEFVQRAAGDLPRDVRAQLRRELAKRMKRR